MRLRSLVLYVSIIHLMLMVMVMSCSPNGNGSISTTDVMVPTPAPTVMVMPTNTTVPTHTPASTVMPYGQVREQVIGSLRGFNQLRNEHTVYMNKIGELMIDEHINMETAGPLILHGLRMYEKGISLWNPPDFDSDEWDDLEYAMDNMGDAELVRIKSYRALVLQLRDVFMNGDFEGVQEALQNMKLFKTSSDALESSKIQHSIIKKLNINPTLIEFLYQEKLNETNSKDL